MTKRLPALTLALALSLPLPLAGTAEAPEADYLGTWVLSAMTSPGNPEGIPEGVRMCMTLLEDGTLEVLTSIEGGEAAVETGAWVLEDGILTITDASGASMPFVLEEGALVCRDEALGLLICFVREEPAAE